MRWNGTVGDSPDFVFTPDPTAGLGSGVTLVNSQNGLDKISTGTKYSAATSGSGSTTTCSPNFVLSGTTGVNYDSYEYCGLTYTYAAIAYPVTINLQGTTKDSSGNLNILVGQRCTASLVGIPQELLGGITYSWSISGKPLLSWTASSSASSPTPGPSSTTDATTYWYWSEAATMETVTCTATVTPPSGKGVPFTLTVTRQVYLQRPTYSAMNYTGLGYIIHGGVYYLQALPSPLMRNYGYAFGSTWHTSVTIPTPVSGSGQFGYAQIITPGEYLTPYGGTEQSLPTTGQTGLDTQFTYLGSTFAADGSPYDEGDSPGIPLNFPGGDPDAFQYVRLTDVFKTYLMFLPSGANSQWVPLAESDWHLNMGAGRPLTGHWSDFGANQYAGGVFLDTNFMDQLSYPTWPQTIH